MYKFIKNIEDKVMDADYSKSIEHKMKLSNDKIYKLKKEEFLNIREHILKRYMALFVLNQNGINDIKESDIDGQTYFIYKVGEKINKTNIEDLIQYFPESETSKLKLVQDDLTPKIFK